MRKDKIFKQMEAVVNETMKRFQSDFYDYDKPQIASPDFKFPAIWIVGEYHAHRLDLGSYKDEFFENENARWAYVHGNNPFEYFTDSNEYKKDRWFLITEDGLQPINIDQAKAAIKDYVNPAAQSWIAEHGPLPENKKLRVNLKGISLSKLKTLIQDCREHGNDSLLNCLKRRQKMCRWSSDHYVNVTYHEGSNEFVFSEMLNGAKGLVGHIVFHGWPETGYLTNGAVQIDPEYGWHSHT